MEKKKFINNNYITDEEFKIISQYVTIRMNKNISQRKLAELTGMAQSTVARVEKKLIQHHFQLF